MPKRHEAKACCQCLRLFFGCSLSTSRRTISRAPLAVALDPEHDRGQLPRGRLYQIPACLSRSVLAALCHISSTFRPGKPKGPRTLVGLCRTTCVVFCLGCKHGTRPPLTSREFLCHVLQSRIVSLLRHSRHSFAKSRALMNPPLQPGVSRIHIGTHRAPRRCPFCGRDEALSTGRIGRSSPTLLLSILPLFTLGPVYGRNRPGFPVRFVPFSAPLLR
jgi:hypothetical protein